MTIKARDVTRIPAAETQYTRETAEYTATGYRTNTAIAKELNITSVFGQNAGLQKLDTTRTKNAF